MTDILEYIKATIIESQLNTLSKINNSPIREFRHEQHTYFFKNALAIQNNGNSGTTLIKSLLDGHPSIATSPSILNMSMMAALRQKIAQRNLAECSPSELILGYANRIGIITDCYIDLRMPGLINLGLDKCGEQRNEAIGIPANQFLQVVCEVVSYTKPEIERVDISYIYLLLTLSYKLTLWRMGRESQPSSNLIFVWDMHGQIQDLKYFLNDFPQAKFLHMIRKPLDAFDGFFEHLNYRADGMVLELQPITTRILEQLFLDISCAYDELKLKGSEFSCFGFISIEEYIKNNFGTAYPSGYSSENIRSIFLESLHDHPKENLVNLCNWLEIDFDSRLLVTTFEGKIWGNRLGSKHIGLSNRKKNELKYLNWINKFIINELTNIIYRDDDVNKITSVVKKILFLVLATYPLKSESIEYISPSDLLTILRKISPKTKVSVNYLDSYLIRQRNGNWIIQSQNIKSNEKKALFITETGVRIFCEETAALNGSYLCLPVDNCNVKTIDTKTKITVLMSYFLLLMILYIRNRKAIYRAFFKNILMNHNLPKLLTISTDKSLGADVAKPHGLIVHSIFAWCKKFGDMGTDDDKRLNQLEQENIRLRKILAERDLEIVVMRKSQ